MSQTASQSQNQKIVAIACPKCRAAGTMVWEFEGTSGPSLVSLSSGFYERLSSLSPYRIEIVCHACGRRRPELVPAPAGR